MPEIISIEIQEDQIEVTVRKNEIVVRASGRIYAYDTREQALEHANAADHHVGDWSSSATDDTMGKGFAPSAHCGRFLIIDQHGSSPRWATMPWLAGMGIA